jgi:hypothetical protein
MPSERAAVSAKASAQSMKASRISISPSVLSETASCSSSSGIRTWTPSLPPSNAVVGNPVTR